jgi:hypothetical protein
MLEDQHPDSSPEIYIFVLNLLFPSVCTAKPDNTPELWKEQTRAQIPELSFNLISELSS